MYALHDELHSHSITIIFTLYEPQILKAIEEVTTLSYQNHPAFRFTSLITKESTGQTFTS